MDEVVIGLCVATDTRLASHIYGASIVLLETGEQQLFTDEPDTGLLPLADAWDAVGLADVIVVPNHWTIETVERLAWTLSADGKAHLLNAIDLQKVARSAEPSWRSYTLKACATRLGMARIDYRGSPVWTPWALASVERDGMICHRLWHMLAQSEAV